MSRITWQPLEQPAGPPLLPVVPPRRVDQRRRAVYRSYETFLRHRLAELDRRRPREWRRDYSSLAAYRQSMRPMRARLQQMLGFWIEPQDRPPLRLGRRETLLQTSELAAYRFPFEVAPGLESYAVELVPAGNGPRPGLLVQHGYAGTPELACGLTATANSADYSYRSLGARAARRGFHVLAVHHPSGYGRADDVVGSVPGRAALGETYGKNRLHRLAIMVGGTLFGLDMLACSRGIDYLRQCPDVLPARIGMYGLSQGGQSALFLPALDERIRAAVCSAYFNQRFPKLTGPHRALCYLDSAEEDKFFPDVIRWFGDADLVSLIAPRAFAVEAGRQDRSVDFEKAAAEFQRAAIHYRRLGWPRRIEFIPHRQGHVSATRRALDFLEEHLQP